LRTTSFGEAAKVSSPDRPGLQFDRPPAPRAFENRINLEQFLASVTHLLSHIPSCARHAFSTQAPNRAGSPSLSGIALGSITARNAFSVTSLRGAAWRRPGLEEYFATGATRKRRVIICDAETSCLDRPKTNAGSALLSPRSREDSSVCDTPRPVLQLVPKRGAGPFWLRRSRRQKLKRTRNAARCNNASKPVSIAKA
jgi:hypothetical protein